MFLLLVVVVLVKQDVATAGIVITVTLTGLLKLVSIVRLLLAANGAHPLAVPRTLSHWIV